MNKGGRHENRIVTSDKKNRRNIVWIYKWVNSGNNLNSKYEALSDIDQIQTTKHQFIENRGSQIASCIKSIIARL